LHFKEQIASILRSKFSGVHAMLRELQFREKTLSAPRFELLRFKLKFGFGFAPAAN
jgi:hypothetical protein